MARFVIDQSTDFTSSVDGEFAAEFEPQSPYPPNETAEITGVLTTDANSLEFYSVHPWPHS